MPGGEYYTTKGTGSQDVYDAYYDEYGTSAVWSQINIDTQANIINTREGGTGEFVTTQQSIEEGLRKHGQQKNGIFLLIAGLVVFKFFF